MTKWISSVRGITHRSKTFQSHTRRDKEVSLFLRELRSEGLTWVTILRKLLGSTVVLVFESKNQIKWNVRAGEKVRYG